jgi:CHAT domain-containing protein/tetratricopeptide (TPR) repeat protein
MKYHLFLICVSQPAIMLLGDAYYKLGEYRRAIEYHQQLLAIIRKGRDSALGQRNERLAFSHQSDERWALQALENSYRALGDYTNATSSKEQRLAIEKAMVNGTLNVGSTTGYLGKEPVQGGNTKPEADRLLKKGEETKNAETKIAILQQALEIYRQIKDREGEQDTLLELGRAYNALGTKHLSDDLSLQQKQAQVQSNYRKAIDYTQESLSIAAERKDPHSIDSILDSLGSAYSMLAFISPTFGDYSTAVEAQQKYVEILRNKPVSVFTIQALLNLGEMYYRLGDYSKAIDYENQSLAVAKALKDRDGERATLSILGSIYLTLGDFSKAIDYHQKSLVIARELKNLEGEGAALNELGVSLEGIGKLVDSERNLKESISVWERQRKESIAAYRGGVDAGKVELLENQSTTYRSLQRVLVAQNKPVEALEISERSRARAFVDLLAFNIQRQGDPSKIIPHISIPEIKAIAKEQNATLVEYSLIDSASGGFYNFGTRLTAQPLPKSTLYVWVIQPSGAVTFRQVDLSPLKQSNTSADPLDYLIASARCQEDIDCAPGLIPRGKPRSGQRKRIVRNAPQPDQARASSTSPESTPPYSELQHLHKILIEPIADLLPKDPNAQVIFVPQGSLFLVPFAALQDSQDKYLIERHTIRVAPSIQVLELTRQQHQKVQKAGLQQPLIVGNPSMPMQLSPLPNAQREAEVIATLLKTKAITGSQATKAAVLRQMPSARIIHLATHGLLDSEIGLNSAIALAPDGTGKPNDGLLTADEILNLKLNAELVVLSACSTGKGRITGDGVIGLSRSLMTAGVPSVLVSLWAVPDDSTAFLMQEFYKQLQRNSDKAQALRQSMLQTLKQYPDIRSWSAFVLMGESQ